MLQTTEIAALNKMYRAYVSDSPELWSQFFDSRQSGGADFFQGDMYQRGNGVFSGLLRGLVRTVLPAAKKIGKTTLKQAAKTGLSVASDVLSGRDAGESFEEHGRNAGQALLSKANRAMGGKTKRGVKKRRRATRGGAQVGGRRRRRQTKQKRRRRGTQTGRGLGLFKAVTAKAIKGRLKKHGKKTQYRDALGSYVL